MVRGITHKFLGTDYRGALHQNSPKPQSIASPGSLHQNSPKPQSIASPGSLHQNRQNPLSLGYPGAKFLPKQSLTVAELSLA